MKLIRRFGIIFRTILHDPIKLCLVLVILLAMLLRFTGVNPGFNPYHPDEGIVGLNSAKFMLINGNLNPLKYEYPTLIPLIDLLILIFAIIPLLYIKLLIIQSGNIWYNLSHIFSVLYGLANNLNDLQVMYWGRHITAFFGVLTVYLTYFVGKKLFKSRLAGLFSALVLTLNFRSVMNSHFDLPDIYNAFFLLLSLYITFGITKKPGYKSYIFAGLAMALSFSVKLQFFSFITFALVHCYLSIKNGNSLSDKFKVFFSSKLFFSIGALLVGILLINYCEIINYSLFFTQVEYVVSKYNMGIFKLNLSALSYFYKIIITPFVFCMVLLGTIYGFKNKTLSIVVLLSLVIPFSYYFFYLTAGGYYSRNFITIIPVICLLAGYGLEIIFLGLKKVVNLKLIRLALFGLICLIVLFESTNNSFINVFSYLQPWSLTDMRSFLASGVKNNSKIASHPWDWYILFSLPGTNIKKNLSILPLDHNYAFSLPELRDEGANYALVGTDVLSDATSVWWLKHHYDKFWQKPDLISNNTFSALSANELFESTLHSSIKPWQAPDNNYVFAKIPPKLKAKYKLISAYAFKMGKNIVIGKKIGGLIENIDSGSLKLTFPNSFYPFVRWESPVFSVEGGHVYKVKALVRSDATTDLKNRDGFLRLDFYATAPSVWNERTKGDKTAVSSRYFGNGWKEIEVEALAPVGNTLATFSFQIQNQGNSFWLNKIEVYKSVVKVVSPTTENSFIYHLPENILVPYTNGNL